MNPEPYLQIPYRKGGRGWDGADCYGFARIVMEREAGISMPPLDGRTEPKPDDFLLYESIPEPEDPCLVLLQGGPFGAAHVAVYADGMILHMSEMGPCCHSWKRIRRYAKGLYRARQAADTENHL